MLKIGGRTFVVSNRALREPSCLIPGLRKGTQEDALAVRGGHRVKTQKALNVRRNE